MTKSFSDWVGLRGIAKRDDLTEQLRLDLWDWPVLFSDSAQIVVYGKHFSTPSRHSVRRRCTAWCEGIGFAGWENTNDARPLDQLTRFCSELLCIRVKFVDLLIPSDGWWRDEVCQRPKLVHRLGQQHSALDLLCSGRTFS